MTRPRSSPCLRSNKTGGRQRLGAADIAERTKPQDEDPYQPAACMDDDLLLLLLKGGGVGVVKKKESCKVGKSLIKPNKRVEKKLHDFVEHSMLANRSSDGSHSNTTTYAVGIFTQFCHLKNENHTCCRCPAQPIMESGVFCFFCGGMNKPDRVETLNVLLSILFPGRAAPMGIQSNAVSR